MALAPSAAATTIREYASWLLDTVAQPEDDVPRLRDPVHVKTDNLVGLQGLAAENNVNPSAAAAVNDIRGDHAKDYPEIAIGLDELDAVIATLREYADGGAKPVARSEFRTVTVTFEHRTAAYNVYSELPKPPKEHCSVCHTHVKDEEGAIRLGQKRQLIENVGHESSIVLHLACAKMLATQLEAVWDETGVLLSEEL